MTQASSFRKLVKKQIPFKLNEFFSNTATPTNTLTSTSVTMDLPGLRKFLALDAIAQPDLWVPTESTAEVMRWRLSVRYGVLPSYRSTSSGSNCAPEVSYGTPIMFRFYTVTSTATTPRRAAVVVTWQTDSVVIVRRLRFGSVYTKACALKGFLQTNEECPHFTGNSFSYSRLHGGHIDYECHQNC